MIALPPKLAPSYTYLLLLRDILWAGRAESVARWALAWPLYSCPSATVLYERVALSCVALLQAERKCSSQNGKVRSQKDISRGNLRPRDKEGTLDAERCTNSPCGAYKDTPHRTWHNVFND